MGEKRSQPNRSIPRKVDSRKNEITPSAASGAPKMSPTKRAYAAQFVPNSNSITAPLATPTANPRAKTLTQKRAMTRYTSRPVKAQRVITAKMSHDSPIVIDG